MTAAIPGRPVFDGDDYVPPRDDARLTGQLRRVWDCMIDGKWRTLRQIASVTGDPEASISAQLRHLRKKRFGAHKIERRYLGGGLYEYKLLPAEPQLGLFPDLERSQTS